MTNLDKVLKSRDVILPTKICTVTAMVFPVVTYGCESWTIKKAAAAAAAAKSLQSCPTFCEGQRINAFELWCWRRLESPLDSKEMKPVNPRGNLP